MNKKQIIGIIAAAAVFVVTGASSMALESFSDKLIEENSFLGFLKDEINAEEEVEEAPEDEYIAIVEVLGTIQEETEDLMYSSGSYLHTTTLEYLDTLMEDDNNKGLLLYVDSPGGTVYESEELYLKLKEYKEVTKKPVWVYMAHYAASGGYMISMSADKIYANPNTTTGSIGVIMSGYDLSGLYEKLGIEYFSITSGEYKDSSQMTEEQMEIYQEQVDEYYERFVDIVEEGRGLSEKEVKQLADGRTYTAKQALELGLIDSIALYDDMKDEMSKELGVEEFYLEETDKYMDDWTSFFFKMKELIPKSEAQILKETAAEMESGVPMYYAEP